MEHQKDLDAEKKATVIWRGGAFAGEFGDPYLQDTTLEGGHTEPSIDDFVKVARNVVAKHTALHMPLMEVEGGIPKVLQICEQLEAAAGESRRRKQNRGAEGFATSLQNWMERLRSLGPGQQMLSVGGWSRNTGGHGIIYILERASDGLSYSLVIVNTGNGTQYHPTINDRFPKVRSRCAVRIGAIPPKRFLDEAVWHIVLRMMLMRSDAHSPEALYEVILPHLVGDRPLSDAIEASDPVSGDGTNGDWETRQRAGFCYYRCVLSAVKYLLHRDGIALAARKQLTLAIRLGFLEEALVQLARYEGAMQDSDCRLIELACSQTARAAAKAQKLSYASAESLREIYLVISKLQEQLKGRFIPDRPPMSSMAFAVEDIAPAEGSCARFRPFQGFERVFEEGDTSTLAGEITDASPDMFVDLLDPPGGAHRGHSWSLKSICSRIASCRERCDLLLRKTSASAVTVAFYQIRALVEDFFSDVIPVPQVRPSEAEIGGADFKTQCPYLRASANSGQSVSQKIRRETMKHLKAIAKYYVAASMSIHSDRSSDSVRHVIVGAMLCIMDGLARASCVADDASADGMLLTQLLVGSDTTSGFWPCLESFGGRGTSLVADAHVLYDPRILMIRDQVLQYLTASVTSSNGSSLIAWKVITDSGGGGGGFGFGTYGGSPNITVQYDENSKDPTLEFVRSILEAAGREEELPRAQLSGRGASRIGSGDPEQMGKAERFSRWYCDPEWQPCPEFSHYRDLIFYYRLSMESTEGLFQNNYHFKELLTPDKVDPIWQFFEASEDTKVAKLRLCMFNTRSNTVFATNPPERALVLSEHIVPKEGGVQEAMEPAAAATPACELSPKLRVAIVELLRERLKQSNGDIAFDVDSATDEEVLSFCEKHRAGSKTSLELLRALLTEQVAEQTPRAETHASQAPPLPGTDWSVNAPLEQNEEDVLHTENLPNFDDVLSEEESERLLTFLGVPYLALPLVLAFFADDRSGGLISLTLRKVLESVVYETRSFSAATNVTDIVPQPLAKRNSRLATRFGVLVEEIVSSPTAILTPLLKIARYIGELCVGDFTSKFSKLLLLCCRLLCRIEAIFSHLEDRPELKAQITDVVLSTMPGFKAEAERSEAAREEIQSWLRGVAYPMILNWLRQSEAAGDIAASTSFHVHLCLMVSPALTVQNMRSKRGAFSQDVAAFLCSAAFVVSWHTKTPVRRKRQPRRHRFWGQPPPVQETPEEKPFLVEDPIADVFALIQQRRSVILQWANEEHRSGDEVLDVVLGRMVATALQRETPARAALRTSEAFPLEGSAWKGWSLVDENPLLCHTLVESSHPYLPGEDTYEMVCFPGAKYIILNFDSKCATEERSGEVYDYVTIYRDQSLTHYWGDTKRIGGSPDGGRWPGANGKPPLIVPADSFVIHFHSDASLEDWGFRFTAYAPVDLQRAQALVPQLDGTGLDDADKLLLCQRALAECRNDLEDFDDRRALPRPATPANIYLKDNASRMMEALSQERKDAEKQKSADVAKPISGLFQDPSGGVQANLQTGEVYLQNRMLMPTPADIATHEDFKTIFPSDTPFCALVEGRTERRCVSVVEENRTYSIEAWTPLRHEEGASSSANLLETAPEDFDTDAADQPAKLGMVAPTGACGGLPDQPCLGMPRRAPKGSTGLVHDGALYSRQYVPGLLQGTDLAWISQLFDPVHDRAVEAAKLDEPPTVWVPDSLQDLLAGDAALHSSVKFLMYLPPSGATEERKGHPGGFFELVFNLGATRGFQVFFLEENARQTQRSCVYVSDGRLSLRDLQPDVSEREDPWPTGSRHASGCMWHPVMDEKGSLQKVPGAGDLIDAKVGSIRIKRSRQVTNCEHLAKLVENLEEAAWGDLRLATDGEASYVLDEGDTEVFTPARFLFGLLPEALLQRYVFWRTGPTTLRGYPIDSADESMIVIASAESKVDRPGEASLGRSCLVKKVYNPQAIPKILQEAEKDPTTMGSEEALSTLRSIPRTLTLLDLTQAPAGSALAGVAAFASRLDNLAYVLCWSSSAPGKPGDECEISLIEFARLNLRFEVRRDGPQSRLRIHSLDHSGLYVAEGLRDDRATMSLFKNFQQGILLRNALEEMFLLLPNYGLQRVQIRTCPLNGEIVLRRDPESWLSHVQTTHYVYRAHVSAAYLTSPGLSASLYLVVLRLFQREYVEACKILATCFTDTALTEEETWVLSQVNNISDSHPNAVATRLKLALTAQVRNVRWNVQEDYTAYCVKQSHVHTVCTLSLEEERHLLALFPDPTRQQYLNAIVTAGEEDNEGFTIRLDGEPAVQGGEFFYNVSSHLTESNLSNLQSVPSLRFRYERPEEPVVSGSDAVNLMTKLLADDFRGEKSGGGFLMLYEMMVGNLNVSVCGTSSADFEQTREFVTKIPAEARAIAAVEPSLLSGWGFGGGFGSGYRRRQEETDTIPKELEYDALDEEPRSAQTSAVLAKLATKMMFLLLTNNGQQSKIDSGSAFLVSLLFAVSKCIETDSSLSPPVSERTKLPDDAKAVLVGALEFDEDTATKAWTKAATDKVRGEKQLDAAIRLCADGDVEIEQTPAPDLATSEPRLGAAQKGLSEESLCGSAVFPAVPYSICAEALVDGVDTKGPLRMFVAWVAYQARHYAIGLDNAKPAASWVGYLGAFRRCLGPQLYPGQTYIARDDAIRARPFFTDFSAASRVIESGTGRGAMHISRADLEAYAGCPLSQAFPNGLEEHIEYVQRPADADMLDRPPFDISEIAGMKTPAARQVQERLRSDLEESAASLRSARYPQLAYLNEAHLVQIERDLSELKERAGAILSKATLRERRASVRALSIAIAVEEEERGKHDEDFPGLRELSQDPTHRSPAAGGNGGADMGGSDDDDLPPALPELGRSPSTAEILRMAPSNPTLAKSMSQTISASSSQILVKAMAHLRDLLHALEGFGHDQASAVRDGVDEIEKSANSLAWNHDCLPEDLRAEIVTAPAPAIGFEFDRMSGKRCRSWLGMLASLPLNEQAEVELQRLNPYLPTEGANAVLQGIEVLQLRCVRLSQLNTCRKGIHDLRKSIFQLLSKRLEAEWADVFLALKMRPDPRLVRKAMEASDFEDAEGRRLLEKYLQAEIELASYLNSGQIQSEFLSLAAPDVVKCVARLAMSICDDNLQVAKACFSEDDHFARNIFASAVGGTCFKGKELPAVSVADFLVTDDHRQTQVDTFGSTVSSLPALLHIIRHSATSLAQSIAARRAYVSIKPQQGGSEEGGADVQLGLVAVFDPRYLVFEFVVSFLLRRRQVELVQEFTNAVSRGESRVAQMIMGAGKTTVVGPLLAIMLADGKRLVMQIMPGALMDMSRAVYRNVFSNVLKRKVLTFKFDRASSVGSSIQEAKELLREIRDARDNGSVVCSDPSSVKALMLKYLDVLTTVRQAPDVLLLPQECLGNKTAKARDLAAQIRTNDFLADVLKDILEIFGHGIALLDEVDLLLHPMKSELNFPVGPKLPLDSGPHRWELPVFMLDLLFFASSGKEGMSDFRADEESVSALREFRDVLQIGLRQTALQPSPHTTLLRPEFYHARLKRIVARWTSVWLKSFSPLLKALAALRGAKEDKKGLDDASRVPLVDAFARIEAYICNAEPDKVVESKPLVSKLPANCIAIVNLAKEWVNNFFPHVLGKVNRVHYGLLHPVDIRRWTLEEGAPPLIAASRRLLAVPFVGKDVPSRNSEFAHPEVLIGLSILAYRYEGLRTSDLVTVVKAMKEALNHQKGPLSERPARIQFQQWVDDAGLVRSQLASSLAVDEDADEVLPLELFQVEDPAQIKSLLSLLGKSAKVITHFLKEHVFPKVMRHQVKKLTASGVDLGSETLFPTRIGFSGTPSDLLPKALGRCHFEPGSEAAIVRKLVSPDVVTYEILPKDWAVESLLRGIAESRQFSALIDTGALITGLSNQEVARTLLRMGLPHKDAVVFLDDDGRKMVVTRMMDTPIPLAQSGVSLAKRFTFYDQVHTTGMDIKQPIDGCAALTLGKDMTARDYAQGAYRMRGLGKGQTIHLIIVEQVRNLVSRVSDSGDIRVDALAWLVVNGIRSEKLQHVALVQQELANTYRQRALRLLLKSQHGEMGSSSAFVETRFKKPLDKRDAEEVLRRSNFFTAEERAEVLESNLIEKYKYIRRQLHSHVDPAQLPSTMADDSAALGKGGDVHTVEEAIDTLVALGFSMGVELDLEPPSADEERRIQRRISQLKAKISEELGKDTLADILSGVSDPTSRNLLRHLEKETEKRGLAGATTGAGESKSGAAGDDTKAPESPTPGSEAPGAAEGDASPGKAEEMPADALPKLERHDSSISHERAIRGAVAATLERRNSLSGAEDLQASVQELASALENTSIEDLMYTSKKASTVASEEQLSQSIDTFLDPLDHSLPRSVPEPKPFSLYLEDSLRDKEAFLRDEPELFRQAKAILERQRAEERAAGSEGKATDLTLGAEIVQEQEQEQEAQKEKDVQKRRQLQHAKGASVLPSWRISHLNSGEAILGGVFYELRAFTPATGCSSLAFPSQLLLSERHTPQIHRADLPRRLPNVEVILVWAPSSHARVPDAGPPYSVVVSLREAETLRRQLLRREAFLKDVHYLTEVALCTIDGEWLTPPSQALADASELVSQRTTMRFYNNTFWFTDAEIIAVLSALRETPESSRRAFFEATLACRRRDRASWQDTPCASVFSYADDSVLTRIYGLSRKIRDAIRADLHDTEKSLLDVFHEWDTNQDGYLNAQELSGAFETLGISLVSNEIAEVLRHADADEDGFLDYREFASQFGVQSAAEGSAAALRARRLMLRQQRSEKQKASALMQLQGLPGASEQNDEYSDTPAGLSLGTPQKGASILDWRRLASVGSIFLTSGGHLQRSGDRVLRTRPGDRPTVTARGVALRKGKWFYEVTAIRAGRGTAGWADPLFMPSQAVGVGDDSSSWGYDYYDSKARHQGDGEQHSTDYGLRWEAGDVLGCAIDMHSMDVVYYLNGQHLGTAFSGIRPSGGIVFPAISFESSSVIQVNFGDRPFRFAPARSEKYRSVMHWVRTLQEQHHIAAAGARYGTFQCSTGSSDLTIDGLKLVVRDGFPSATLAGVLLTHGKWYYEFTVLNPGVAQIGWADLDFVGSNREGLGVGDDKHSWGYDGARAPGSGLWYNGRNTFGQQWSAGTVIGCAVDVDFRVMRFSHNGSFDAPMGVPGPGLNFEFTAGLIPGFTLNPSSVLANFGATPFKYKAPPGHLPVWSWVESHRPAALRSEAMEDATDDDSVLPETPTLHQTISQFGPLPPGAREKVSMRASSGFEVAVIEASTGDKPVKLKATARYPTFVGDVELTGGRYFFEVAIVKTPGSPNKHQRQTSNAPVALGFADKMHFGDYANKQGAGDDAHSWALLFNPFVDGATLAKGMSSNEGAGYDPMVQVLKHNGVQIRRNRKEVVPSHRKRGSVSGFGLGKRVTIISCAVDCASRQIFFAIDGEWYSEPAFTASSAVGFFTPVISIGPTVEAHVRLTDDAEDYVYKGMDESYLPVGQALEADLPRQLLAAVTPAPPMQAERELGEELENLSAVGRKVIAMLETPFGDASMRGQREARLRQKIADVVKEASDFLGE